LQNGIDVTSASDTDLQTAFGEADRFLAEYQIRNNVGPHWGSQPEHWIEADLRMYQFLGLDDIDRKTLLKIENAFKYEILETDYEFLHEDSHHLLTQLKKRGYKLGICTRRHDDPSGLLKREGIVDLISAVTWSGVPGYAKPSPYTLLEAAEIMGINPRLCAYVGNLVEVDVRAAQRAGMQSILLTWGNPGERCKAEKQVTIKKNPLEILDMFD
jgi:FMN phosphatase YigB (HAD superfamily)